MGANRVGFFSDWTIRFSQPSVLNDPFELKPHISKVASASKMRKLARQKFNADHPKWGKITNENLSARYREAIHKKSKKEKSKRITKAVQNSEEPSVIQARPTIANLLEENIASLCLSETKSDLLMWAHYAGGHQGFVVEFDTTASFFRQLTLPPHIPFDALELEAFRAEYGTPRKIDYVPTRPIVVASRLSFNVLLTKSDHWFYEREWRMLMPPNYADVRYQKEENEPPVFLYKVPASCVTGVIIGCNASELLQQKILDLRFDPATCHIKIQQATIDDVDYKLNFLSI